MAETVEAGIARLCARLRILRTAAAGEGRGTELERLVERARRGQTPEPELSVLARDLGVVFDTGVTRGPWPWDGGGHTAAEIYGCPAGRCAALLQCARARCRRAPVRPRRGPTVQSGRKDHMMSAFLGELGKRLAEMWLTVLVLPGLLFTGVAVLAGTLGHTHALDVGFLLSEAAWRSRLVQSAGATAVLLAVLGALLAAAARALPPMPLPRRSGPPGWGAGPACSTRCVAP